VFNGGTAITDYFIEYSDDGSTWALFSDGTSTLRATAVTGLTNGTPYYFRVYAINSVGMGVPSAPSSPVTPLTSPTAPTISRIDTSNALLTVYFSPGDDGGNPITSYQYSTDGGATWQTRTVGSTSSPLVISALSTNGTSALANGTTYSVQIRAVNSAGAGNASLTTTATPVTVPTAPLSVVATPGNASISLNWNAPASNGGATITDYEVEYSTNGGSTWFSFINGTSAATSASITSLTNGTSYTFRVSAVNSVGVGVASVWSTSVAPRTVPTAPTNLAIVAGAGSITASWTAASSGGSTITDFIVEYSTDGNLWTTFNDGLSTSTSTTITGLTNGTAYYVRVSAVNVAGESTAVVSGSTATPKTTPSAPSISAITADNQSLSVAFTAGATGGSAITSYQYSINGGSTWTTASGASSPIVISSLTNGTQYQVALRAVNVVGNGNTSNILASTPRTVPDAPTISSITAGANQGSVAFTLSGNGGSAVTDYEYRVNAGSWSGWISAGTTTSPLTVANLVNGTAYDVQIRAVNIAGAGSGSSSRSVTPFSSPGAPTITGVAAGRGQIAVSFAAGVTGGSAITNYQYSIDGGTTWVALNPASTTSPFTITGLADSTTYNIQLKAVNVAGSGAASSAVAATTWGVPAAPTIVSSTARDGALDVAFVSGANGGDSISNYEYSIDGGATWITRNPASIVSPLVISGLTNGTSYPVQLRAVNSVGASSASATATLKPHAVPSAPVITNQSAASQTITIAFTAGGNGGEEILGYEYSTDRGATWYPRTDSGGTTSPMTITKLSTNGTTDLANGTTYNIQVRALSLVGNGSASADVAGTPATTPSAPTNLEVVNGDRYLLANFIPGSNGGAAISSYQYSTDNGSTWRTASATTSPLTITTASSDGVTALNNGTAYIVLVRAVNAQGAGTASSSVSGTPRTNPDAPGSVVVSSGDATISVAFVANANDGGSAVTGYEYSTDGGATWRLRDPGTSMTSSPITITKLSSDGLTALTNGTAYDVLIRAVNTSGPGEESATQTAIPASAPSAPAITSITPGDRKLSIAFSAGNNGGNAVVRNEYSLDGGSTWVTAPSLNSPIVITGLTNGTAYALQVRQVNALGNGASSVTVEGIPSTIPAAPTVNQVIAGNATLSVDFSSGATGGSDITSYQYSTDGGATWSNRTFGSTESPLSITTLSSDGSSALVNGTFYSVKIRAVNSAGSGVASEAVRIAPLTVPSAPVISSVAMRNSFALLTFSVASDGGSPVTAYEYSLNAGITWTNASSLANPMRISGLRNGSNYSIIIRALNIAGAGNSSATSSIAPIGPPDAPRINTLTPGDQTLEVAFTDGATSGSPITGYEYSIDGGNTWPAAGGATSSPFTITGLTNGTIYTVRIRAVNANGSGTSSDPVVSKPYTVPSAPVITQIDVDGNNATLEYTAPASNGGQAITSYEYSIDSGASWVSTNSASVFSVQISNLVENQDYQVGVRAVNSAGPGAVATVSTQSIVAAPTSPSSPQVPALPEATPSTTIPKVPTTTPTTTPVTKPPVPVTVPASVPVPDATLEVLPGSGGVPVPPGSGAVVVDGKVADLIVTVAQDGVASIEFPGEFVVRITPRNADGTIIPPGEGNAIRAYRGRTVEVGGEGFAPNTVIEVWVNSEPILLGTVTTDSEGKFSKTFDLPVGLLPGQHTLTLGGTTKKGQVVKASVGLIVEEDSIVSPPASETVKPIESYDPQGDAAGTMTLIVNALVLLAIAGAASRKEEEDEDRGSGDVSDVSVKQMGVDGDGADKLRLPRISLADRIMARSPEITAHRSPMIGRVLQDGTYLRSLLGALWLLLPVAGVALGLAAAFNTDFEVVMPSLALLSALVVIGTLDAFAGFLGAMTFATAVLIGGGVTSSDSIRGLLGIWVLSFAVPMLASASRPFRRKNASGLAGTWDRSADFVLILLFGALAAGSMFSSLPGLTGFRPEFAGNVAHIQIVAMIVLATRFVLENATVKLTPARYHELTDLALRDASNAQQIVSSLIRTAVYLFVAEVFIGNNWALWVGGALYLAPKLVGLVVEKFPNVEPLHRWMPRGIFKVTVMMLIARIWGLVLTDLVSDPAQMIMFSFVFMGTPGVVATVLGWFGRSSTRAWPQTWFTRIAGLIILIIGFLMVRGVLFAF
jgi:titin